MFRYKEEYEKRVYGALKEVSAEVGEDTQVNEVYEKFNRFTAY